MSINSTSRSATCSEHAGPARCTSSSRGPGSARRRSRLFAPVAVVTVLVATAALCANAYAKVFLSRDAALELAFGRGASIDRRTDFLTDDQLSRAQALAGKGVRIERALVTRYVGTRGGKLLGTAYLDTHRVRTMDETLMIVVSPGGRVERVEVVSFKEPEEYKPKPAWFSQFDDRRLDDELAVKRGIHGITGATLSAAAATEAVRRTLAVHRVLAGPPGGSE